MTESKTGIAKMVEWLEIELKKAEQYCDVNIGAFIPHPFQTVLDKAHSLLAEEQAQKPTADKGLWEAVKAWQTKTCDSLIRLDKHDEALDEILSRYKPA